MIRHEERLSIGVEDVAYQSVRVRRRVITETVMVPVQRRREILEIEVSDLDRPHPDGHPGGDYAGAAGVPESPGPVEPLFVVELREEVPEVSLRVRTSERVHVGRRRMRGTATVTAELGTERIVVETAARRP